VGWYPRILWNPIHRHSRLLAQNVKGKGCTILETSPIGTRNGVYQDFLLPWQLHCYETCYFGDHWYCFKYEAFVSLLSMGWKIREISVNYGFSVQFFMVSFEIKPSWIPTFARCPLNIGDIMTNKRRNYVLYFSSLGTDSVRKIQKMHFSPENNKQFTIRRCSSRAFQWMVIDNPYFFGQFLCPALGDRSRLHDQSLIKC
jgi:hypothetical protein